MQQCSSAKYSPIQISVDPEDNIQTLEHPSFNSC